MTPAEERSSELVAPVADPVDQATRTEVRDRLVAGIRSQVADLPAGDQLVVDLRILRLARRRPDLLAAPDQPFVWRPAFARRSMGLAVVDACLSGRFRTPLEALDPVATEAVEEWERTGWRQYHWEPWLAALPPGARAAVLADALGWATALWVSFDWAALHGRPVVGGPEDQWVCPAPRTVRLRSRPELRVPLVDGGSGSRPSTPAGPVALVSVSGGSPDDGWREELGYLALIAGMRSPTRPVPARVLGLWPDAGTHRTLEIDAPALLAATDRLVATVGAVVEARRARAA